MNLRGKFFLTRVIDDVFIMHRCHLGEDGGWDEADAALIEKMRP